MGRKKPGRSSGTRPAKPAGASAELVGDTIELSSRAGHSSTEAARGVEPIAVEVDRAAILAEAQAAAAEAPAEPVAPSAPGAPADQAAPANADQAAQIAPALDPSAKATEVQPAVRFLVAQVCNLVAPAWQITDVESNNVADATALVLAYWMPDDAVHPKYLAILSLAGALWGVAAKRRTEDGEWTPLRKKAKAPAPPPAAPPGGSNVTQLRV